MKYIVTLKTEAYCEFECDADSEEEAIAKAYAETDESDFYTDSRQLDNVRLIKDE